MAYVIVLYSSGIGDPSAAYQDGGRVAVALIIFTMYAAGVGVYHAFARRRARRFLELQRNFTANDAL